MILLSGATGFVGKAVVQCLLADDESQRVAVAVRKGGQPWSERVQPRVTGDLEPATDWSVALEGVSAVVHCAARVHVMHDTEADPLTAFRTVNVDGTLNLARQAAAAGVKRFVFISSVKVNGESTEPGRAFTEADTSNPQAARLALAAGRGAQPAQLGSAGQPSGLHRYLHNPPPSGQPDFFGE